MYIYIYTTSSEGVQKSNFRLMDRCSNSEQSEKTKSEKRKSQYRKKIEASEKVEKSREEKCIEVLSLVTIGPEIEIWVPLHIYNLHMHDCRSYFKFI